MAEETSTRLELAQQLKARNALGQRMDALKGTIDEERNDDRLTTLRLEWTQGKNEYDRIMTRIQELRRAVPQLPTTEHMIRHVHDLYRIVRARQYIEETGVAPSELLVKARPEPPSTKPAVHDRRWSLYQTDDHLATLSKDLRECFNQIKLEK